MWLASGPTCDVLELPPGNRTVDPSAFVDLFRNGLQPTEQHEGVETNAAPYSNHDSIYLLGYIPIQGLVYLIFRHLNVQFDNYP